MNQENQPTVTKFPKTGKFTVLGPLLLFLFHCSIGIVKNSGFSMSLYCIPVSLFLKFEATLFSALHLVLCWSFGIIGINSYVRFGTFMTFLSVGIRLRNGDRFGPKL